MKRTCLWTLDSFCFTIHSPLSLCIFLIIFTLLFLYYSLPLLDHSTINYCIYKLKWALASSIELSILWCTSLVNDDSCIFYSTVPSLNILVRYIKTFNQNLDQLNFSFFLKLFSSWKVDFKLERSWINHRRLT